MIHSYPDTFSFGPHRGRRFAQVYRENPAYVTRLALSPWAPDGPAIRGNLVLIRALYCPVVVFLSHHRCPLPALAQDGLVA